MLLLTEVMRFLIQLRCIVRDAFCNESKDFSLACSRMNFSCLFIIMNTEFFPIIRRSLRFPSLFRNPLKSQFPLKAPSAPREKLETLELLRGFRGFFCAPFKTFLCSRNEFSLKLGRKLFDILTAGDGEGKKKLKGENNFNHFPSTMSGKI